MLVVPGAQRGSLEECSRGRDTQVGHAHSHLHPDPLSVYTPQFVDEQIAASHISENVLVDLKNIILVCQMSLLTRA